MPALCWLSRKKMKLQRGLQPDGSLSAATTMLNKRPASTLSLLLHGSQDHDDGGEVYRAASCGHTQLRPLFHAGLTRVALAETELQRRNWHRFGNRRRQSKSLFLSRRLQRPRSVFQLTSCLLISGGGRTRRFDVGASRQLCFTLLPLLVLQK